MSNLLISRTYAVETNKVHETMRIVRKLPRSLHLRPHRRVGWRTRSRRSTTAAA